VSYRAVLYVHGLVRIDSAVVRDDLRGLEEKASLPENLWRQLTDAPKGDARCAKPKLHLPFGASLFSRLGELVNNPEF